MKHKSWHDTTAVVIFSIALVIILIFGSFNMMIFSKNFYRYEYAKNHVYEKISYNSTVAINTTESITDNIFKYFRGTQNLNYFTDQEKSHMKDVKQLINIMQGIYYAAAIFSIVLFFYWYHKYKTDAMKFIRLTSKVLLYSSIVSLGILLILFIMSVFYFDLTFYLFHTIFFPQGNWMFDASTSMLLTLFPEQFFFDITLRIFLFALFQSLVFLGMGYWMKKQLKVYDKHKL